MKSSWTKPFLEKKKISDSNHFQTIILSCCFIRVENPYDGNLPISMHVSLKFLYKLYRYHITWIHWRYQWMVSPFPLKKAAKFLYIKNGQTNTSTLLKAKCRITPLVWRGTLINKPQWKSTENRILFTCWFVCTHSHKHAHTINKKQENTNHSIICIYKTPLFSKDLLVELM